MEKGCLFEFSEENRQYYDFIRLLIKDQVKPSLIERVVPDIMTSHIEYLLDSELTPMYQSGYNIYDTFYQTIETLGTLPNDKKTSQRIEDFLTDMSRGLIARLKSAFTGVHVAYAIWSVRPISASICLIEYVGDYRIMEWHERSSIAYDQTEKDIRHEVSVGQAFSLIRSGLEKHISSYGGNYFNRSIEFLCRIVVEDSVFPETINGDIVDGEHTDFLRSREKIIEYFPLITEEDLNSLLVDAELMINETIKKPIQLITRLDNINTWFINDNVLTILIDRPLTKVDFGERLKTDIRASIANGDWVPPKLRRLAGID